jgi:hypothetical protein
MLRFERGLFIFQPNRLGNTQPKKTDITVKFLCPRDAQKLISNGGLS